MESNFRTNLKELLKEKTPVTDNPKPSKLLHLIIGSILSFVMTMGYIEIGHTYGWERASRWYTCIHTHHHFPWQK